MKSSVFAALRAPVRSGVFRLSRQAAPCRDFTARFASTATQPALKEFASKKLVYPERLLVYNAGTGRTAYVGFFKVMTIFIFAGGCLIVAPAVYYDPNSPSWMAPAVILAAAAPMVAISVASSPFVNSVFLYLPTYARYSKEALVRYASTLPPTARLELVTISFRGSQKTTGCTIGELRKLENKKLGIANIERVAHSIPTNAARPKVKAAGPRANVATVREVKGKNALRKFIDLFSERRNRFFIDPEKGSARSKAPGVIQLLMKQIAKNSSK